MSELKTRIMGRFVFIALLFVVSLTFTGVAKFVFWLFGSSLEFRPVFWITFLTLVILYVIWCLVYKFVFGTWIDEFNDGIARGMNEEAAIKKANEKSRAHPPLKIALLFAKNQRDWKMR